MNCTSLWIRTAEEPTRDDIADRRTARYAQVGSQAFVAGEFVTGPIRRVAT
jgi:hypothetical protein